MMREIHLLVASCMHLTGAGIEPATQARSVAQELVHARSVEHQLC